MKWRIVALTCLFAAAGALVEDRLWSKYEPYIFIGFTILGGIIGFVWEVKSNPFRLITEEDAKKALEEIKEDQ